MLKILRDSGVEIRRVTESFKADGTTFPAGSFILPAAQPYRAHLKDMMERQVYPKRLTAGGKAETPYDVAGWTLPLQMGVEVVELAQPITSKAVRVEAYESPRGSIVPVEGDKPANYYVISDKTNDDVKLRMALHAAGVGLKRVDSDWVLNFDPKTRMIISDVDKGSVSLAVDAKSLRGPRQGVAPDHERSHGNLRPQGKRTARVFVTL